MKRRDFIATSLAGLVLVPGAAAAQGYELPPSLQPEVVRLRNPLPAGEVHVFPDRFRLYWTLENGHAWEYAIRVGRDELYESGEFYVGAKKEWPSWMPTSGMIEREPEKYAQYAEDGMKGGPGNPLGARALYLFQEGRGDTFLRIHGTNDPATIGRAVSNGCAGLTNEHVKILYEQVPLEAKVVLHPKTRSDKFSDGRRE